MTISLISPNNSDNIIGNVIRFGFYIPTGYTSRLIFKLDIDTVNTFNSGNLMSFESRFSQAQWKYYENSTWNAIEESGIATGHDNAEARVIINQYRESSFPETETLYYWRISSSDDMTSQPIYKQFVFGQATWGVWSRGEYNTVIYGQFIYGTRGL